MAGTLNSARRSWWLAAWAGGIVVLAILLVITTDEPAIPHTSALSSVFDSRWMVAGARLVAAVFLVYVVASVGVRMKQGQWVRSVGPVDTDAQELVDSQADLQEQVLTAVTTINDLSRRLKESDDRYVALAAMLKETPMSDPAVTPDQGGGAT